MTKASIDPLDAMNAAFNFLVEEFGFVLRESRHDRGGFLLRYQGDRIGVQIDWFPRDPLTVWLVRLVDNEFPERRQSMVRADSTLHYFDLGHLEAMHGGKQTDQRALYAPSASNAELLAASLRDCAADLLAGDLTRIDALQEYVKERARQITIAHYGADYARTMGW